MTPILIKSFRASAAVAGHVIVAAGAANEITAANGAGAKSLGVTDGMGAAAGGMGDVVQLGWGEVRVGANVEFGDPLTADANGFAVPAEPTAGTDVRIVGWAMSDGGPGDIIPLHVVPGIIPAT